MTAADALNGEPETFEKSVFPKRLQGIMRTGRRKAALWSQKRRKKELVHPDEADEWKG
jgi:hypothetical protein